jgi:creatinine amidohydrolase
MRQNDSRENTILYLRKLSSPAIEEAAGEIKIILLPVGSLEQHGPHLPIDVDMTTAEHLAQEAILAASRSLGRPAAVLGPPILFGGPGLGMDEWPGTIRLSPQTFIDLYKQVGSCLARAGFQYIIALNGCLGNTAALTLACQILKSELPETHFLVIDSIWADREAIAKVRESSIGGTGHAGEIETSIALAVDPQHVAMSKALDEIPHHPSGSFSFDFEGTNPYLWPMPFGQMTRSGVMGQASLGTTEKGERILRESVKRIADALVELNQSK